MFQDHLKDFENELIGIGCIKQKLIEIISMTDENYFQSN
jgi:hypothetical protein